MKQSKIPRNETRYLVLMTVLRSLSMNRRKFYQHRSHAVLGGKIN